MQFFQQVKQHQQTIVRWGFTVLLLIFVVSLGCGFAYFTNGVDYMVRHMSAHALKIASNRVDDKFLIKQSTYAAYFLIVAFISGALYLLQSITFIWSHTKEKKRKSKNDFS